MQSPRSFLLFVAVALTFSVVYSEPIPFKPTLVFDKPVVQENETLQYSCTGFKYNNKTAVSFFTNDMKLFDSTTNKTETGITKINSTSISLSAAFISKMGLKNAYCLMNASSSFVFDAIPYISKIKFTLEPKTFKVGTPINASCIVTVLPSTLVYNVTFQRNEKPFGQWAKDRKTNTWVWQNGTAISGASLAPGVKQPPPFSVMVNATKKEAAGRYRCTAVLPVGVVGKTMTFTSASLSNGAAETAISTLTAFVTGFVALALFR